jgi:hypothetical protein
MESTVEVLLGGCTEPDCVCWCPQRGVGADAPGLSCLGINVDPLSAGLWVGASQVQGDSTEVR